jgi:hypothetical protein
VRTDLESGAWIEHVPVQDLRYGHKRALDRAVRYNVPAGAVDDEFNVDVAGLLAGFDISGMRASREEALFALLITAWSYELPVPELDKASGIVTGAEAIDELPIDDAEEIGRILAPHAEKLGRRPDPKGSTTSSSNGSSRANAGRGPRQG